MQSLEDFETLWELMSTNEFDIGKSVPEELKCIICCTIMKDAHLNLYCDCRYCLDCIRKHLHCSDGICPGGKEHCGRVSIGIVATPSMVLNRKISLLEACCPNESCTSRVILKGMSDHLRLCAKQPTFCPFRALGCESDPASKDDICNHLQSEALNHAEIMVKSFQNLKNDFEGIKSSLLEKNDDAASPTERQSQLTSESSIDDEDPIEAEGTNVIQQNNPPLQETNDYIQEISALREELALKDSLYNSKIENLEQQVKHWKEEFEKRETEFDLQKKLIEEAKKERESMLAMIQKIKSDVDKCDKQRQFYNEDMERRNNKLITWNKLIPNNDYDFVCKMIVNQETIMNDTQNSDPFYYNERKWCMSLRHGNNGSIGLHCHIMKGDNDESCSWPFIQEVTLMILDQVTFKSYKGASYRMECKQPTSKIGTSTGLASFERFANIKDKSSIVVNDSILVSVIFSD